MELFEQIKTGRTALSVVGLGYVGMPLAVAFAGKGVKVIGFDISRQRIEAYRSGRDFTREVGDEAVKNSGVFFTWEESALREARFHIVAVPTPINQDHTPDLDPVESASTMPTGSPSGTNWQSGPATRLTMSAVYFVFFTMPKFQPLSSLSW